MKHLDPIVIALREQTEAKSEEFWIDAFESSKARIGSIRVLRNGRLVWSWLKESTNTWITPDIAVAQFNKAMTLLENQPDRRGMLIRVVDGNTTYAISCFNGHEPSLQYHLIRHYHTDELVKALFDFGSVEYLGTNLASSRVAYPLDHSDKVPLYYAGAEFALYGARRLKAKYAFVWENGTWTKGEIPQ